MMGKTLRVVGILIVALVSCGFAWADGPVAIVADISGSIAIEVSPVIRKAASMKLFERVRPNSKIEVGGNARVTLFFPGIGQAFDLNGPGNYEVTQDNVRQLSGTHAPKQRQLLPTLRNATLLSEKLAPAAVAMRGKGTSLLLEYPAGLVLDAANLEFRWVSADSHLAYVVRIAKEDGTRLYEAIAYGAALALPDFVRLPQEEGLVWTVRVEGEILEYSQGFMLSSTEMLGPILSERAGGGVLTTAEANLLYLLLRERVR